MADPHLYHFCISHFNEKVRWALDRKRWPHRRTALTPGFHLLRVRWLTGQEKTPVLELDGRILHDSTRIIAELERLRPDPPLRCVVTGVRCLPAPRCLAAAAGRLAILRGALDAQRGADLAPLYLRPADAELPRRR